MTRAALAATRAVEVLDFLAAHPTEAFSLSEIARRLDVNLASTHAVLNALAAAGYLTRHPRHRTFTLGPGVIAAGSAALVAHPAIDAARDEARVLAEATGLQATVTAVAGDAVVFVASAGRQQPHGVDVRVGQRVPLVPPLGSVYYAWAPPDEVDAWLGRAVLTRAERDALGAVLVAVRSRGCSIGLDAPARHDLEAAIVHRSDEPTAPGVRDEIATSIARLAATEYHVRDLDARRRYDLSLLAAPVFDLEGRVPLAITLVGFAPGLRASEVDALVEQVRGAGIVATKLSRGRVPDRA
ncbi:MAG: helix-turn-helix domain-containing protein [Acidimicrobiia bacterium]|jgi:DNA-binding IclR family transcriptional regulator